MQIIALLFILLSLFSPSVVLGQSSDFNKSYTDYNSAYDVYQSAESNYEIKRGQYLSSKTVAATGEAQTATFTLLQARDEAVFTYLIMIRQRLAEAVGVDTSDRDVAFANLDVEIAWFSDHKSKTSSSESLDDLVSDSKKAQDQYNKTTSKLIYKTLSQIAIAKETYLRQKQLSVLGELNNVLSKVRADNIINTDLFDRSALDIQNTIDRSAGKNSEAMGMLSTMDKQTDPAKVYGNIVSKISEGIVYLRQASTSLREIVYRITTS